MVLQFAIDIGVGPHVILTEFAKRLPKQTSELTAWQTMEMNGLCGDPSLSCLAVLNKG
jgi:hypothetical protein